MSGTTGEHFRRLLKKAAFSPAQPRRAKTRRSAGKAAASEGPEVHTALCVGRSPLQWVLANGKTPPMIPTSERLSSVC